MVPCPTAGTPILEEEQGDERGVNRKECERRLVVHFELRIDAKFSSVGKKQ